MRIAILTRRFNPDGGGTERDLIVTCRYLKEAGHEVEVYVARVRGSSEWLTVRRVPVLPLGRTVELFFFAHLAPVVARRSGAELIISFGRTVDGDVQRCGGGVCRSYLEAALRWRGRLGANLMKLSPYRRLQVYIERRGFCSPRLLLTLAVSDGVNEDLRRIFDLPSDRVLTVYNGVDLQRFRPVANDHEKREARRTLGLDVAAKTIAFVGNGFARKGLAYLMRALGRTRTKINLVIAGRDRTHKAFERLAKALAIEDRVTFLGSDVDVALVYRASDALALPSLFEPFGNVVLEAMASGVPPLVSAWTGAAEILPSTARWLVVENPLDIDDLARRIDTLVEAPREFCELMRATAERFTWQRYGEQVIKALEHCLSAKRDVSARIASVAQ